MIYGYIRVSSDKQTVENQRFEINKFCGRNNLNVDGWIEETISGTKSYNKRELGKLLRKVQKNDLIICAELSRLGRNLFMIMEDFSKPKIIWKRVGSILRFSYNDNGAFGLDSTCFSIGNNIEYICCVLNSPMGHYLLKDSPKTGTGDLLVSVQAIEPLRIPHISEDESKFFQSRLEHLLNEESSAIEQEINQKVFDLYDLSLEEREYVNSNFS